MIWVTLPIYNERHTAGVLLWRLRQVFGELERDFRILAVDDASTDDTAEVLEPYARVLPLTVVRNETRLGQARTLERLIREAVARSRYPKRDGLLVMQADFTDGPEAIPEMMRHFQGGADMVVARPADAPGAPRGMRAARAGAVVLTRSLPLPEGIEDPLTGFRLYRLFVLKKALERLAPGEPLIRRDGWGGHLELLSAVAPYLRRSEQIEVPVTWDRRYRASRFRPLSSLWSVFLASRSLGWPGEPGDEPGEETVETAGAAR